MHHSIRMLAWLVAALGGCESAPPGATDAFVEPDAFVPVDASEARDAGLEAGPPDAGASDDAMAPDAMSPDAGPRVCEPLPTDYTPRIASSSSDTWPACISDDGVYHVIDPAGLSTPARVAAYESMFAEGGTLDYVGRAPSSGDFTMARTAYAQPNGLGSRVNRRTDEHYPPVMGTCTMGTTMLSGCQCPDVAAANPEYCVGPGTLLPIIQGSFRDGQLGRGDPPQVLAARIDAALQWFLYVSVYKESLTCSAGATAKDCDSAWAYYTGLDATGASDRAGGIGLARLVRQLEVETHERVWDGLLAVRCWRDLDRGTPVGGAMFGDATMPELRDRARAQTDRALLRGMAAIAIDRLRAFERASGTERAAHLAFLQTWLRPIAATTLEVIDEGTGMVTMSYPVPARPSLFDRALREADAAAADFVASQMAMAEPSDVAGIAAALDAAFPCP